jgi:signal transduction histidine kinase/FixJ family two-component response regulator
VIPLRILLLEDDERDTELTAIALEKAGYGADIERVATLEAFVEKLVAKTYDLIFADHRLPGFTGVDALAIVLERGLATPFILISGTLGEEQAVEALKAGATDYVLKARLSRLGPVVKRALAEAEARRRQEDAEQALRDEARVADALAHVGQELIASLGSSDLLERLCTVTAQALGFDSSHTLLRDPNDGSFRPLAGYGMSAAEQSILSSVRVPPALTAKLLGRLETADVAQATPPIQEASSDGFAVPPPPVPRQLCMALRRGDQIIGIQVAGRRDSATPFTAVDQRIARGIARLASIVLEHDRLRHELERANRLKSDFLATMSHELRTPLHIIIGYVDSLLEDAAEGTPAPDQGDRLERVAHSARKLLELINSTLEISRLETSEVPISVSEVRLPELVAELKKDTLDLQERSGLEFRWHIDPSLPTIRTDRVKLGVILKNLLDNAVKFTPRGTVAVAATSEDGEVGISVSDTGIGIPADARAAVFESFFQIESPVTHGQGGVGLGLYIVKRLLELLDGRIEIESEPGRGSTFRVRLPVGPPRANAAEH